MEMVRRVGVMGEPTPDPTPDDHARQTSGMARRIFSRENGIALAVCLLVILLIIVTTDSAPQWIYQGF